MQAQRIRGDTMKEKEEGAKPQKSGFLVRLTALAATAALLGLECTVYMGADAGGLSGPIQPGRPAAVV